jgi:hypothetical protein
MLIASATILPPDVEVERIAEITDKMGSLPAREA